MSKERNKEKKLPAQPWFVAKKHAEELHKTCAEIQKANDEINLVSFSLSQLKKTLIQLQSVREELADEEKFLQCKAKLIKNVQELLKEKQSVVLADMNLDIIKICIILANRYKDMAVQEEPISNYKRAIKYIDIAIKYKEIHTELMNKCNLESKYNCDEELEKDRKLIEKLMLVYEPILDSDSEILMLRKEAKLTQDQAKITELYQKAKALAVSTNDYMAQFDIINDQMRYYVKTRRIHEENPEYYKIYAADIVAFFMNIIALAAENKVSGYEVSKTLRGMPVHFFNFASGLEIFVNYMLSKDVEKKLNLLTDCYKYVNACLHLSKQINYTFNRDEIAKLHARVVNQIMVLQLKLDKINEEKTAKEIAMKKEEKKYKKNNQDFSETLKRFPDKEYKKKVVKKAETIWNDDNVATPKNDEPAPKIVAKPAYLDPKVHMKLLEHARQTNNIGDQIFWHTNIGEDHKKNAYSHFKYHNYDDCIDELKKAISHFTPAYQLIQESNRAESKDHVQKEISLTMLLEGTKLFLETTIKKQIDIKTRFEKTRLQAMEKMGDKWYTNENVMPSIETQILANATYRLEVLKGMQQEFAVTFGAIPNQENPAIVVSGHSMFLPKSNSVNNQNVPAYSPTNS